jgi:20S proteasome subunit beta 1
MAADSRSTSGSYVANRSNDKLWPLAKNIVACKSGSAADTQFILGHISKLLSQFQMEYQGVIPVKVAATLMAKFIYKYKNHFSAGLIIGGVDEEGSSVYSVRDGSAIKQDFLTGGSGSVFLTGFSDMNYNENFSKQNAIVFAKTAISLAINRDNSSGGGIRLIDITNEGFTRHDFSFNELEYQN